MRETSGGTITTCYGVMIGHFIIYGNPTLPYACALFQRQITGFVLRPGLSAEPIQRRAAACFGIGDGNGLDISHIYS